MTNKKILLSIVCLPAFLLLPYAAQAQQGIDISAGSNITIIGAAFLEISNGDFVNNGSYTKGDETVILSGNTAQKISGSNNINFNNLSFSNTTGITTQLDLLTCNNLTVVTGGKFTVDASKTTTVLGTLINNAGTSGLLLKSDDNGTASLLNNSANVNATVQRFIENDNNWHLFSAPVAGQLITPAFAPTTMDATFDFYKWDESIDMTTGLSWVNLRSAPTTLNPLFETSMNVGRGYLVAYSPLYTGSETHSFAGLLGNGDKSIAVTYSGNHYVLIGNPYPSAMDWDASGYTNRNTYLANTNPGIWSWNESAGNYGVYSMPAGTNDVTNIIAPHQGFFVQTIAAGSFTVPNSARIHPLESTEFLKSTIADMLKLKVSSTVNKYSDEMIVKFDANSNSEGISKWFSMLAEAPSLFSVKNNVNLTINTLATINSNTVVNVGFKAGENGNYNINASGLNSFAAPTYIYLEDLKTNTITDLNLNAKYSFTATTNDNVNRFQLIFALSPLAISENAIQNTNIFACNNTITINSTEAIQQIVIYNTLGQLIKTIGKTSGTQTINMNGNTSGYYIVKVVTDKNVYSEKVLVK